MKFIIILILTLFANYSTAVVIWPGSSAPCNTTLSACADSVAAGEVIEIRTNGPIDESLSTSSISLIAGDGYKPVFTSGNDIDFSVSAVGTSEFTISGLTLVKGRISIIVRSAPGQNSIVNITNNHIIENDSLDSIRVNNLGAENALEVNIAYNRINYIGNGSGGITLNNGLNTNNPSSSEITGRIYNNQVKSIGSESIGIGLYGLSDSSFDIDISSNTFFGGGKAGTYIEKIAGSIGSSRIDFAHNATYSNQIDDNYRGIMAEVSDGALEINAINNTIISAFDGFNFQENGSGELDVNLYNNIVAYSSAPVILNFYNLMDSAINIANDNNLFYDNELNDPDFVIGPNFIADNPKIKSLNNGRLNPGSPAIEAGNGIVLFGVSSVPLIDADGLIRIKNGNPGSGGMTIDVGAYEAGDMRVLDKLKGNPNSLNPIENTAINSDEFAKIQITNNLNPNGTDVINGVYNNVNIGVYRNDPIWIIFNQNDSSTMNTNAAFNVWSPAPSGQNYVHTAADAISASESFTELDRVGLNDNPDAILSVTQLWEGLYNDNPIGVFYNPITGRW
ncbi:MAG: choice-of-anchor Q domain-containing protein, partial [Marinicellaceae bacterium]